MSPTLTVRSYAKINWSLDVLHRREDGYHEIRTLFQTVSLHDLLVIKPTDGAIEVDCSDPGVPRDERNLAFKAALALKEAAGVAVGARIEIDKRIPVGGGLGGGSSNAAATLVALHRLWGVEPDSAELVAIAARLGSDVPFFLVGGTALGVGRGDEVYPVEEVVCDTLLLANPGSRVSTTDAYAGLSRLTRPRSPRMMTFALNAAKGILEHPPVGFNDLEEVVMRSHQEIARTKRDLLTLGARCALMSGSGSTVYAVFENEEERDRAVGPLRAGGLWCQPVRTVRRSEYRRSLIESES